MTALDMAILLREFSFIMGNSEIEASLIASLFYFFYGHPFERVSFRLHSQIPHDLGLISGVTWFGSDVLRAKRIFRFKTPDIHTLRILLGIPQTIEITGVRKVTGDWAFALFLLRMTGTRISVVSIVFNIDESCVSKIFKKILEYVCTHACRLSLRTHPNVQSVFVNRLPELVEASAKMTGVRKMRFWGYIDGTDIPHQKPGKARQAALSGFFLRRDIHFNGHKRYMCTVFLAVCGTDGLFWERTDYRPGSENDHMMQRDSGIQNLHVKCPEGGPASLSLDRSAGSFDPDSSCFMFGDSGFTATDATAVYFRTAEVENDATGAKKAFNQAMKPARVSVEHGFGRLFINWKILESGLRLHDGILGMIADAAMILHNCHACLYPNQISSTFGVQPPTVQDYLYTPV